MQPTVWTPDVGHSMLTIHCTHLFLNIQPWRDYFRAEQFEQNLIFFCWTWYDFIIISDCNIAVRSPPVCRDRRRISFLYRVRSSALRANTFSAQQLFYNRRRRRVGSGGGQTEPMTSCQATRLQKWECSECTEVRGFESWSKQLSSPVSASQHTHAPAAVAACVFFSFIFSHTITGRLD